MAREAMIIEGSDKTVIVEDQHAYLMRTNGRRRHLGRYAGMSFKHANSNSEQVHIQVQTWVNPNFGPIRRAWVTTNLNSFILPIEGIMELPTHTLSVTGPVRSRMVPVVGRAA